MICVACVMPSPLRSGPDTFEIPKSRTLMLGSPSGLLVRNRFSGFMSRCTMPAACASASASHAWRTWSAASAAGSAPTLAIFAPRSSPSRYSITM